MIVVHGVDRFGRVDSVDGEYMVTRFLHLFLLPIIPLGGEWVMKRDGEALLGHPCRMSRRSVVAAYLRIWGVVMAAVCIALGMIVPAVIAGAAAMSTWWWWRMRGWGALQRVAVQRAAFGSALDPLQLTRAGAVALLPGAQERLAEISGGRTAVDVARDGAVSLDEAGRAFVVLRLAARVRRGGAAEALAASQRILDGDTTDRAADGPYRTQEPPAVAAPAAVALLRPGVLRPHRWHWFWATVALYTLVAWQGMRHLDRLFYEDEYPKHARSGVRALTESAYPQWRRSNPDSPCPTVEQLAVYAGTVRDPWGSHYRVRCYRVPLVGEGIVAWSIGEDDVDCFGEGDDIASWYLF